MIVNVNSSLAGRTVNLLLVSRLAGVIGRQYTAFVLPFVAIQFLHASGFQAASIFTLEYASAPLAALFGMPLLARSNLKHALVLFEIFRVFIILSLFGLGLFGQINMTWLYLAATLFGANNGISEVGRNSVIPKVVPLEDLPKTNGKLSAASSTANILGQSTAGACIQLFGWILTLLVDAFTSVVACISLSRASIPNDDLYSSAVAPKKYLANIKFGFSLLKQDRFLMATTVAAIILNLGGSLINGIFAVYAYRELRLAPAVLGIILSAGGFVAVPASLYFKFLLQRIDSKTLAITSASVAATAHWLIPLSALTPFAPVVLAMYEMLFAFSGITFALSATMHRQTVYDARDMTFVTGAYIFLIQITLPLGSILGGILSVRFGTFDAMIAGCVVSSLTIPWLLISRATPQPRNARVV